MAAMPMGIMTGLIGAMRSGDGDNAEGDDRRSEDIEKKAELEGHPRNLP
jgi:hypothetical protein